MRAIANSANFPEVAGHIQKKDNDITRESNWYGE
jgi:hypothetical protein